MVIIWCLNNLPTNQLASTTLTMLFQAQWCRGIQLLYVWKITVYEMWYWKLCHWSILWVSQLSCYHSSWFTFSRNISNSWASCFDYHHVQLKSTSTVSCFIVLVFISAVTCYCVNFKIRRKRWISRDVRGTFYKRLNVKLHGCCWVYLLFSVMLVIFKIYLCRWRYGLLLDVTVDCLLTCC